MAAAVQVPPGTTGSQQELSQYDKIIALRNDVFAGKHPRLRLPSATTAAAPAANVAQPDTRQASSSSALPNGHPPAHKPIAASEPRVEQTSVVTNGASSSALPAQHAPHPVRHSPKLDPIFLTKSDDLIREEMKLERRRIELALENQLHQKKVLSKRNAEPDVAPDFDLSEVLQQAQELVKHLPAHVAPAANRVGTHSDSIDEATYYSSQVNETSTDDSGDRAKRKTTKPCKFFFEGSCRKGDACSFSHDPAFKQKLQGLAADADHSEFESDPNRMGQNGRNTNGGRLRPSPTYSNRESGELIEDSPYSPSLQMHVEDTRPEPNAPRDAGRDNFANRNHQNNHRRGRRSPPIGERRPRASPEMRDGKVVRNHITSPLAPQPSRVSPLAVAKIPRLDRLRQDHHEEKSPRQGRRVNSHNQSPASQPQGRKRRREADIDEAPRNVAPRTFMESPAPEIKEEPMSPPPFNHLPSQRYAAQEEVVRVPVEYVSTPRQRERVVYQTVQPNDRDIMPSEFRRGNPQSSRRVFSGPEVPYETMNGHPVRRVVTSRYPERLASPVQSVRDYPAPPSATFKPPIRERTPHLAPVETRTNRGSVQPQQAAYPASNEPTSPEIHRVQYSPIERRGSVAMAPPRRIVMDQDGNRYYEAVRPEVLPPTVRDPYYDGQLINSQEAPPQRMASVRPQTARVVSDSRYVQRVASPSVRYVEYRPSIQALPPQPVYEPQERAYRGSRGEIVHLVEYPQDRREVRYSEMGRPQEIVRMSSVAPRDPPGYEMAPPQEISRMQSVQPREAGYEHTRPPMPHAQSAQPEGQPRIVELGRQSVVNYPREMRELSARPQERYARQEQYVEAPRPRYRYVSDLPLADYDLREMDGGMVMEGAKENQRPVQRL